MEAKSPMPRHFVLIVEDEPLVRLMAVDVLAEAGFAVLQAGNADEALRVLDSHPQVRVVFCDIELPGSLNGLGLARCICERWPAIGLVLTSGHPLYKEMAARKGRFLAKPYAGSELVHQIEEAMR
jgi:DNA-binding NtrC family response regulator